MKRTSSMSSMAFFGRSRQTSRLLWSSKCCQPRLPSYRTFASTSSRLHSPSPSESSDATPTETESKQNAASRKPRGLSALRALRKEREWAHRQPMDKEVKRIFKQSTTEDKPIRARFAPSPTGYIHLGSLRTALFNNLIAVATKGQFIIRIEDTDQNRLVHDAEEKLLEDLKWAGIKWDEGPDCGGAYGPYRQSERLDIYRKHVDQLINEGHAYRCFCSGEQLDSNRRRQMAAGELVQYPGTCRNVSEQESSERAAKGERHVVRFHGHKFENLNFKDGVHGTFRKKDKEEDFIIMKTDGFPTYHLANVVDDHLMKITHVVRGEEWLISTPKHLALYQAFGWEPPQFAHLGLLAGLNGYKLSKRDASASLEEYQRAHTFPMALLHWLANLGCSTAPDAQCSRDLDDLAENMTFKFTSGSIMINVEKLARIQHHYGQLILHDPPAHNAELYKTEESLIYDNLVAPILKEVDSMAGGIVYSTIAENIKQPFKATDQFRPVPALTNNNTPKPKRDQQEAMDELFFDPQHTRNSTDLKGEESPYDPDKPLVLPEEVPDEPEEQYVNPKHIPKTKKVKYFRNAEDGEQSEHLSTAANKAAEEEPEPVPSQSEESPLPDSPEEHVPGKNLLPLRPTIREPFHLPHTAAEDFDPRADYIISALTARSGELVTANKMISQHPYLFFRLPPSAYHRLPYELFLDLEPYFAAFDDVLRRHPALWSGDHSEVVHRMLEWMLAFPRDLEKKGLHAAVRMVVAGVGPEVSTMSTGAMLQILGRDECLSRMEEFKGVLISLEKPTDKEGGRVEWWFEEDFDVKGREAW